MAAFRFLCGYNIFLSVNMGVPETIISMAHNNYATDIWLQKKKLEEEQITISCLNIIRDTATAYMVTPVVYKFMRSLHVFNIV